MSQNLEELKTRLRASLNDWWKNHAGWGLQPWHKVGPIEVYMRNTPKMVNGVVLTRVLTLATIGVSMNFQGKGLCREVLLWMEEQPDAEALIVEGVLSCRLESILSRNGWSCINEESRTWFKERGK